MSLSQDDSSSESLGRPTRPILYESDSSSLAPNQYLSDVDGGASQSRIEEESGDEVLPLRSTSDPYSRSGVPSVPALDSTTMGPPPAPSTTYGVTSSATTAKPPQSATLSHSRSASGSNNALNNNDSSYSGGGTSAPTSTRPTRPPTSRMPSHAYAPPRRPSQFAMSSAGKHRSSSGSRARMNPDADYRAQKRLYAQRLQQDNADDGMISSDEYTPSLGYSEGSETEDESPNTNDYAENDPYDQENILYYENSDMQPSAEELKIPANRERLEWHSMLASVLTGDVVKQEKRRLIGGPEHSGDNTVMTEVWMGVRARVCGRTIQAQKRMLEEQRSRISFTIEDIVLFEVKGETEVGKSPRQQVSDIVNRISKLESMYPTTQALAVAHPKAASDDFKNSCEALISWHNTTELINTELGVLQAWVGNEELDFSKARDDDADHLSDGSSFIERILKEDGLKSLQGDESLLHTVGQVIKKAKETFIHNASAFINRHLPPYIEELLILINFPSRLVQEIIRMRLSYATKMKDSAQQGSMITEQMISQFQIFLNLAVRIKNSYLAVSRPQPGWDLPPCMDENFDAVVLDALRFYFKMLHWKLSANKNTFKEADFLEQEWSFCTMIGRHFVGGDVEVAEQFSSLTSKSLHRLTTHFEKELQRRPDEVAGAEMDKRYKSILDSVRVRQRKLFRFSRLLTQTFENAADFEIPIVDSNVASFIEALATTGHVLVKPVSEPQKNITVFASLSLHDRPTDVAALLGSAYRAERTDPSEPYALIVCVEQPVTWEGPSIDVEMLMPKVDLKPGKLRVVAEGAQSLLQNAKDNFLATIDLPLDVVVAQRANLSSVDKELQRIRRIAYKLSNTIMDSVGLIRKQLAGLPCQELLQGCFAFATEFGQRSLLYMDHSRRALNNLRLTRLALDWISFICDDCIASERKTFRWAVVALEFAMVMTRGQNILSIADEEYAVLRAKVSGCMSLLISHFDIMGARSTVAAQAEKQRFMDSVSGKFKLDISKLKDDDESTSIVREQWMEQLHTIDDLRKEREAESKPVGRVLEGSTEADRSLTWLSASATNVTVRWQQGQYIGGGTFGSVYVATNIDSGHLMAVKEIRLQDPQMIPTIVVQIRDEMSVLQILTHPNIVDYHGIEVHRDKVYIFMEYCSGGSLANLLEHGRIEDEMVITVYALQMLEGLAYLHESGVVHRDVKPENILLDHNGVIKYVDFGAAKIIARQSGRTLVHPSDQAASPAPERRQGRQKSMTGTPMYMSPEVIRGTSAIPNTPSSAGSSSSYSASNPTSPTSPSHVTSRPGAADIWSLGCVILEMATGRRPWASLDNEWAIMYNIAQGNAPALPSREQLSEPGIDFLRKCFDRDPMKRATAAELLQSRWIMALRGQLNLEPGTGSGSGTPNTSREGSEIGSASTSQVPTRSTASG